jgi:hypothetical protein
LQLRHRCPDRNEVEQTRARWNLKLPGAAGDSLANGADVEEVLRMAGNVRLLSTGTVKNGGATIGVSEDFTLKQRS